ncbi:MAG: DEAD/DEAH box helicase [Nitrosopumilus sp.]|nr:DEAD/DEAH box helicase [Nitrosopumilus sp.]
MRISELGLPKQAADLLESEGYSELWPPQEAAVKAGAADGGGVLVAAPTASGKTLTAMLAIIGFISRGGGRAVYLSPLRALASEKYAELKKLEGPLGIKVGMSIGGTGPAEARLAGCGVLVFTNERLDSILRRGVPWASEIGLAIADEVHLVGDETRGPALEAVLTRLVRAPQNPQVVALSATVSNAKEVSRWLGCKMVSSSWRPVRLTEGVCANGEVVMSDGRQFAEPASPAGTAPALGVQCVEEGGQSLVFAPTRPRSRTAAIRAAAIMPDLPAADSKKLEELADRILAENEKTDQVEDLARLVRRGAAFHHAGLAQACRTAVESGFRDGLIRLIASTPTLAAGVNLPARRVVVSSVFRYDARLGRNAPISVMEYKQLCGRAGRPQYDEYGEAIIADSRGTSEMWDHYVHGEPEPVSSHMMGERAMRMHALGLAASDPGIPRDAMLGFFSATLGGRAEGRASVEDALDGALDMLESSGLIYDSGGYRPTVFGRAASEMYLDPAAAVLFRDAMQAAPKGGRPLGMLREIVISPEFYPRFSLRQADLPDAADLLSRRGAELLDEPPPWVADDQHEANVWCPRALLALDAWISERTAKEIAARHGVEAGDLHNMVDKAVWLSACLARIARAAGRRDLAPHVISLGARLRHGIKADLLDLVRIRGIGRVRARRLYLAGIRTQADVAAAPRKRLAGVQGIGPALAARLQSGRAP